MDKESTLEIMEKLIPLLPAAGVAPGSPAAKQYAREMFRLIGNQSLESVMDLAEQSPPQQNPKMMEIQAKVKAKQQETEAKIKGKQQETQVKIQGQLAQQKIKQESMQQKLVHDHQKNKMDTHKNIINTILQSVRASQGNGGQENGNGFES